MEEGGGCPASEHCHGPSGFLRPEPGSSLLLPPLSSTSLPPLILPLLPPAGVAGGEGRQGGRVPGEVEDDEDGECGVKGRGAWCVACCGVQASAMSCVRCTGYSTTAALRRRLPARLRMPPQGKNRPLDEDELQFLDEVAAAQAARLKAQAREEDAELAAFLEAQQQQQQQQQGGGRGGAGGAAEAAGMAGGGDGDEAALAVAPPQLQQHAGAAAARPKRPPPLVAVKALVRPVVRVAKPSAGGGCEPEAKRPRAEPGQQRQQEPVGGSDGPSLAGLLGGYGSGSEEEAD